MDDSLIILNCSVLHSILDVDSMQAYRYRPLEGFLNSLKAIYLVVICFLIISHSVKIYLSGWGSCIQKKCDEARVLSDFSLAS